MDTQSGTTMLNEENRPSQQDTLKKTLSELLEERSENLKDIDMAMADEDWIPLEARRPNA